jgi:ATP-binding protein involved in chromosome partitioning
VPEELDTTQVPPHIMAAMRERMKMAQRMGKIKHKIVVMSGKGGVGKSTVASNLACVLAAQGTVGLVDADVTGPDIAMIMGVEDAEVVSKEVGSETLMEPVVGPNGVKVISMAHLIDRDTAVVWRGPLKIKALKQMLSDVDWGELDYLVIDLPPGTSDEPLSIAQELPDADGALVVTTPQEVSLLDVRKSISFAKAVNLPILGVVENMSGLVCPHCGKEIDVFKVGGGEAAAKELGLTFLGRIPLDPRIVVGGDSGKPFVIEHPDSEATKAFRAVVAKLKAQLKDPKPRPQGPLAK